MKTEKKQEAEKQQGKNPYMEMYAAWEKIMAENLDTLLRNPAFLTSMGQVMERSLTLKEHMDRAMGTTLRAMHLPSTRETDQILADITALREEVTELRTQVERLSEPHKAEVHSLKEKPKRLEQRTGKSRSTKEAANG